MAKAKKATKAASKNKAAAKKPVVKKSATKKVATPKSAPKDRTKNKSGKSPPKTSRKLLEKSFDAVADDSPQKRSVPKAKKAPTKNAAAKKKSTKKSPSTNSTKDLESKRKGFNKKQSKMDDPLQEAMSVPTGSARKGNKRKTDVTKSAVKRKRDEVIPDTAKKVKKEPKTPGSHKLSQMPSARKSKKLDKSPPEEENPEPEKESAKINKKILAIHKAGGPTKTNKVLNRNFYPSIGRGKKLWTEKEVLALINGVKKFGEGRWTEILKTAPFKSSLGDRDRESIKDKYRQLKEQAYRQQNE